MTLLPLDLWLDLIRRSSLLHHPCYAALLYYGDNCKWLGNKLKTLRDSLHLLLPTQLSGMAQSSGMRSLTTSKDRIFKCTCAVGNSFDIQNMFIPKNYYPLTYFTNPRMYILKLFYAKGQRSFIKLKWFPHKKIWVKMDIISV